MTSERTSSEGILNAARRVLSVEANALNEMSQSIPDAFVGAVEHILAGSGRVIVSGIGKSGHIGRKISATLASTGTPSYFVHSAEASHGDLGMIAHNDILLLLSNSGETGELRDIISHAKRFDIPLMAISSNPDSSLVRAANYPLVLPAAPEACAIGLAPTTSTTMALALGDALAVTLMEKRGFSPESFRIFHPGGKLGAQLVTVKQIMRVGGDLPLVREDTPMSETLLVMTSKGVGLAGVVRQNRLVGVVSDGDLRRNLDGLLDHNAGQVASRAPVTISPDDLVETALSIMNGQKINALIVVSENGTPQGVLHVHDCLRVGSI